MAHGTNQAILGLGAAGDSGAGTDTNQLDVLIAAQAAGATIADAGNYTSETTIEGVTQELLTYRPRISALTADSADVNASTTLVASGLSVTFPIAGTYEVRSLLPYTTAAAADIKIQFAVGTATVTGTVGTSDLWFLNAPSGDATVATVPTRFATSWTTAQTVATTGAPAANSPLYVGGLLVVTVAGTLTVKFAQGTSDASNTHIDSGAYLVIQRVA